MRALPAFTEASSPVRLALRTGHGNVRKVELIYERNAQGRRRAQAGPGKVPGAFGRPGAGRGPHARSGDRGPGAPHHFCRHPGQDRRSQTDRAHQRDHPAGGRKRRLAALHAAGRRDELPDLRPAALRRSSAKSSPSARRPTPPPSPASPVPPRRSSGAGATSPGQESSSATSSFSNTPRRLSSGRRS